MVNLFVKYSEDGTLLVGDFLGTVTFAGNVTIAGDLDVSGDTTVVDATTSGQVIIDVDNAEALLVRKDGDAGDVFTVDTTTGNIIASADVDSTHIFGRASLHSSTSDNLMLSHYDLRASTTDFALRQDQLGATRINTAAGKTLVFSVGNSNKWYIDSGGTLTSTSDVINASVDTDVTNTFGRVKLWSPTSDNATFAHVDMVSNAQSALIQNAAGWTQLNAKTGQNILIGISGATDWEVESDGDLVGSADNDLAIGKGDSYTPTGYRTTLDHVQTTDATVTNIWTIAVAEQETFWVEAKVVCQETGDAERAFYHIAGLFYRAAAGALTQQGATASLATIESDAAYDCDFNLNGNTLELQVTGAVGDTTNWVSTVQYMEVNDS